MEDIRSLESLFFPVGFSKTADAAVKLEHLAIMQISLSN